MPDSKISDLTVATALDGTEVLPIVQGGVTKQVSPSQLGVVLFNDVVNDVIVGTGVVDTFDLGSTVNVPTMEIGDKLEIQMTFKNNVAPATDGFGLYFYWYNEDYTPYSATTATYGNSILQFPYTEDSSSVDITVTKISATDVYIQWSQKTMTITPITYVNGSAGFYQSVLDTDTASYFEVQAFATTGGEIELEYLYIKHTK